MDKIGVMAVVEGLNAFMGDMNQVDKAIDNLVPTSKLLGGALDWLGGIVNSVAGFIANTLAHALGELLADAVEWATRTILELIGTSFELANELQRVAVRLDGLNLNLIQSDRGITDYTKAMEEAKEMTKEQLQWIQQLAVASPFPPDKIAELYTAARQMDMTEQEARELTMAVLEFTAGVGGSDEVMDRVILNLRQMGMAGKVTGREMSDLARGALMPLEDVLVRMAEKMGISTDELRKLISTGEGVDPMLFVQAFEEMVKEEPRFVGAMGRLGRTFEAAMENFKQLLESLAASNIIIPVLEILGESIAQITDQFVYFDEASGELFHTEKWDAAVAAASDIGESLAYIVEGILDLAPSAEGIADGIVSGLEGIAAWLNQNKDIIVEKVKEIRDWIFGTETREGAISKFFGWLTETAVPFITDTAIPQFEKIGKALFGGEGETGAFQNILGIITALTPAIEPLIELLGTLGEIIVIAFGGDETQTFADFVNTTLIPTIESWTTFLEENKNTIAFWIGIIGAALVAGMIFATGLGILTAAFGELGAAVAGFFVIYWASFIIWEIKTLEKLNTWAEDFTKRVEEWSTDTKADIDDWSNGTWTTLDIWAIDTQDRIGKWSADTMEDLNSWADDAIASNENWSATTLANIDSWSFDADAAFANWKTNSNSIFATWSFDADAVFGNWFTKILADINSWSFDADAAFADWAAGVYDAVRDAMASFDWFSIGADIIASIINGFLSMTLPILVPPPVAPPPAPPPPVCFIAGTLVQMADGTEKPIEDVQVSELVISCDTENKLSLTATVTEVFHHTDLINPFYLLVNGHLGVTPNHILFINGQWRSAETLKTGDKLHGISGEPVEVVSLERIDKAVPVFNLHTDNPVHNYFADGVLVHNVKPSGSGITGFSGSMVGQMSSQMAGSSVNSSSQITNNHTLNIISSAPTEPIISDFGMLRSMQGA